MERAERWALYYKGKIVPIGNEIIKWIKQDPTEIWGVVRLGADAGMEKFISVDGGE